MALAPQHPEARAVFEKVASEREAPIVESKDLVVQDSCTSNPCLVRNADGIPIAQQFDLETDSECYPQLTMPLLGHHQFTNATTAVAAIECLKQRGYIVPKDSVYTGLRTSNGTVGSNELSLHQLSSLMARILQPQWRHSAARSVRVFVTVG